MSEVISFPQSSPDNSERTVYDLPWITRAVNSQATIPLEDFFNSLLPEHTLVSTDVDAHIEEVIRNSEYSDADVKKSFTHLFNTFSGNTERRGFDGDLPGGSPVANLRVPDCAIIEIDPEGKNTGVNGEYYTKEETYKSVWHLLAKRASDTLSTGIPRNHIYGVYVNEDHAHFLYYDHSAVIVSERMNWAEDVHSFWKAIYTISNLRLDRIGCAAQFITFPDLRLHINGLDFEFIEVVQASKHLIGECTSMIHAHVCSEGPLRDQVATIKFNFIPKDKGWKYENNIVSDLREKMPKRAMFLPIIITSKVFESSAIESEVHKLLGGHYQCRELCVTIYAGQLYPVTRLGNDSDILKVFRGVMKVLQGMHARHSLYHRSLNLGNVLFRKVGNDIQGVLTGYELCTHSDNVVNGSAPSCLDAVESLPFLLPDLYNNIKVCCYAREQCHRFDLESIYFLLFFIATHYDNGKRIPEVKPPFKEWFGDDNQQIGSSKMVHVLTEMPDFNLKTTSSLAKLQVKLVKLHYRVHYGYRMRKISNRPDEVLFFMKDLYFFQDLFDEYTFY